MEDFLTLTSLDFWNISSDISALWAHGSILLDVNKANGMLAGNAKRVASRIFCDNVTCFGTNKAGRRKLLVEFLSCTARWSKKQGAEMLTGNARRIFCEKTHALSDIGLSEVGLRLKAWESSRYLCPADCFQDILFQQAGNSHWNKLGILTGTSWHFMAFLRHIKWHICSVDAWKYLTWCQQGQWKAD